MPTIKIVPMPGVSVPGPQGPRGLQGIQGETGLTGPIGPSGDSAYDIAVANGFVGTEQEWLESISGSGSSADLGDYTFISNVATVQSDQAMILNTTSGQESEVKAQLVLDPNNNAAILSANGNLQTEYFSTGDWSSATWTADGNGGSSIHFVTSWNFLEFANTSVNDTSQITVLINEAYPAGFDYYTYDGFENLYVYLNNVTPPEDPTINNIQFQYVQSSKIAIDYDDGIVIVDGKGLDVRVRSDDDVYIEARGDDLFLRANDAIRFTANWESGEETYGWRMNSDGKFRLPEEGFISNPRATVATTSSRNLFYTDSYLNDQSGVNDSTAVLLPVDVDSSWFADYGNQQLFDFPAVLTFADSTTVDLVAIYDATNQGTPAIVAQWSGNLTKTFEEAYPLSIYVDYTTVTYDGSPTIAIDPSGYDTDQKLVVDVTAPNHVHLRAGGAIDRSTADIILGGEDTHVRVSDESGSVNIFASDINIESSSAPSSLNINTYSGATINSARTSSYSPEDKVVATIGDISGTKTFDQITVQKNDGTGQNIKIGDDAWIGDLNVANYVGVVGAQDPAVGGIILGNSGTETIAAVEGDIYISSGGAMALTAAGGNMNFYMDGAAYIGNSETDNRIVTVGELDGAITDAEPDEISFVVNGGTTETQPTFSGDPLFSGTYVKHGPMVHFQIQVDMDNITSFGTGQYYVDLPFPVKYGYTVRDGCLHDASTGNQWSISGHVFAGDSRMTLWFTSGTGQDEVFDHNSPINLSAADNFHVSGTYITL